MGIKLKKIYVWVCTSTSALRVGGICLTFFVKHCFFSNSHFLSVLVAKYFEIAVFGTLLIPIEPVLFVCTLVQDVLKKETFSKKIFTTLTFLLTGCIWALYLVLFIRWTGF